MRLKGWESGRKEAQGRAGLCFFGLPENSDFSNGRLKKPREKKRRKRTGTNIK